VHGDRYFDYHHSPADTLDKVDPDHLAANVAAVAGLLWGLANEDEMLTRSAASSGRVRIGIGSGLRVRWSTAA
jgi:hypothetical protein